MSRRSVVEEDHTDRDEIICDFVFHKLRLFAWSEFIELSLGKFCWRTQRSFSPFHPKRLRRITEGCCLVVLSVHCIKESF